MTLLSELHETVQPLPSDMNLETMLTELEKRMSAAKRGLGFANRLKNPIQKKKHMGMILSNMNAIRGSLSRAIKQIEQFTKASSEYETGISHEEGTAQNDIQQEIPGANRAESRAAFAKG